MLRPSLLVLAALAASAFDFDEEDLSVPSTPTYFAADDDTEMTAELMHAATRA